MKIKIGLKFENYYRIIFPLIFSIIPVIGSWLFVNNPFIAPSIPLRIATYSLTMFLPFLVIILLAFTIGISIPMGLGFFAFSFFLHFLLFYSLTHFYFKMASRARKKYAVIVISGLAVYYILAMLYVGI